MQMELLLQLKQNKTKQKKNNRKERFKIGKVLFKKKI